MIVAALVTARAGVLRPERPLPRGVQSPVLALELLQSPDELRQVVLAPEMPGEAPTGRPPKNEEEEIRKATYLDFVFIATYVTFLALAGMLAMKSQVRIDGLLVIAAAIGAGIFDVLENLAILRLLSEHAGTPRSVSCVKWGLFFAAVGGLTRLLIDRRAPLFRRVIGYVAAVVTIVTGVEGLWGVWLRNDLIIESVSRRSAVALLLAVVFLATHDALRHGVLRALNRLASTKALRRFANWPEYDPGETVDDPLIARHDFSSGGSSRATP
jgi:hypothetical protein